MALLIWAAVAASLVAWGTRWWRASHALPAHTQVATDRAWPPGDWSRPLGGSSAGAAGVGDGATAAAPAERRLMLLGVIAAPREGVALIAVDGQTARAYRPGAAVAGQWVVRAIDKRGVTLASREGGAPTRLDLPALPPLSVAGTTAAAPTSATPLLPSPTAPAPHPAPSPTPGPSAQK